MKEQNEMVVLNTSDEAAAYKTGISGWVSRGGRYWGDDERMARWDGCTHIVCGCGSTVKKGYTMCQNCQDKRSDEKFKAMPRKLWDGETPLCVYRDDRYFFDQDSLYDYCDELGVSQESLQLVICEPLYATEISPQEYYENLLPDDVDVPPEIADAFDELNRAIRECKVVMSWEPGKFAADLGYPPPKNLTNRTNIVA